MCLNSYLQLQITSILQKPQVRVTACTDLFSAAHFLKLTFTMHWNSQQRRDEKICVHLKQRQHQHANVENVKMRSCQNKITPLHFESGWWFYFIKMNAAVSTCATSSNASSEGFLVVKFCHGGSGEEAGEATHEHIVTVFQETADSQARR